MSGAKRPKQLAVVLVPLLLMVGGGGLEVYPFTGWQMFSHRETAGVVDYWRVLETDHEGRTSRCDLGRYVGALADTRYRDLLDRFVPHRPDVIDAVLAAAAARAPHAIAKITIERRRWNFRAYPDDPGHGTVLFQHVWMPSSSGR